MLFERLDIESKLFTLPFPLSFNLIYGKKLREELVCGIITRSESAALSISNNNKDDFCHNCKKQECQDINSLN